jgi:hypothetical protein
MPIGLIHSSTVNGPQRVEIEWNGRAPMQIPIRPGLAPPRGNSVLTLLFPMTCCTREAAELDRRELVGHAAYRKAAGARFCARFLGLHRRQALTGSWP